MIRNLFFTAALLTCSFLAQAQNREYIIVVPFPVPVMANTSSVMP